MSDDLIPEFGIMTFYGWQDILPNFPNVNVYESLAVINTTIARLDLAAAAIAQADTSDVIGGEAGRQEALDRMSDVRVRLAEVWNPILQERIAALGTSESCESLEAPGSGVFTWFYEPGPIDPDGYVMEGEWQTYGITQSQATTYYTPEYTAPDAYLAGYLQNDALYAAEELISGILEQEGPSAAEYNCVDPQPTKDLPKDAPKKTFPWWVLAVAALGFTLTKKR